MSTAQPSDAYIKANLAAGNGSPTQRALWIEILQLRAEARGKQAEHNTAMQQIRRSA